MKNLIRLIGMALVVVLVSSAHVFAGTGTTLLNLASNIVTAGRGAYDESRGSGYTRKDMAADSVVPGAVVAGSVVKATMAGAGALSGYAGTASAVSTLGLQTVVTTAAGWMGSSATGAAATAVVTSAVGGPVIMGGLVVGTSVAIGYGVYKGGQMLYRWVKD